MPKPENLFDEEVDDESEDGCACRHGVRDDQGCSTCQADGCPGGSDCTCGQNVPRSRRHLYSSTH